MLTIFLLFPLGLLAQEVPIKRIPASVYPIRVMVEPVYPEEFKKSKIRAEVILVVAIGPGGDVLNIDFEKPSGYKSFDRAAFSAVAQWKFNPDPEGGNVSSRSVKIPIVFGL